jgi:Cu(I)/Ag(I) efflux system membrane fusion protein
MNKSVFISAIFMLIIGLAGGYWLAISAIPQPQGPGYESEKKNKREILFYRSPMNPAVTSPVPAKDSMGMDYVPVYADDDSNTKEAEGTVKIDGVVVQNIGVRTTKAVRDTLFRTVRAVGRVAYDEERMVHLHPKIEGWIEKLYVDKTGQFVVKDTDLLSIYSPQLVTSQQEYLLALNNLKALKQSPIEDIRKGAEQLVKSSRERLKFLDMPAHQIHELENSHKIKKNIHIHAPADGIVMKIGAREGQFVTPATEIYMIADLKKVWVYADIYEYELPWVQQGDPVEMELAGIPGTVFKGHLAYIYPYAEPKTRTIKVRLVFDNPDLLLKPEMFAEVTIYASKQLNAVVIPSEAVIRSGTRNLVFIVRGPGKFEPREVRLGLESSGKVAVLDGVTDGEEVVTSAQFLIDSESKLREAIAKMLQKNVTEDKSLDNPSETKQKNLQENKIPQTKDHSSMENMDHSKMKMPNMEKHNHSEPMDMSKGETK